MAGLAIRAAPGDWGGASLPNVEAVARSAAATFPALEEGERLSVVVEPTPGRDDPPITFLAPTLVGEWRIGLNIRGNLWARLAYQFAHEYCHVLAGPSTWAADRLGWLEEVLCETASLFALRAMARSWLEEPPYPNWRSYAPELARYACDRLADPSHQLPADTSFDRWLAECLPLLQTDLGRRDESTLLAARLLRVFEADPAAWRVVRRLHATPRLIDGDPALFLDGWRRACPRPIRPAVDALAASLGLHGPHPSSPWGKRIPGDLAR